MQEQQFVVDLLTTLQKERFSLPAWGRFLVRSWHMAKKTATANSTLTHSWQQVTTLMIMLMAGICCTASVFEGPITLLRLLPGFICCVVWQQSDLFWHLGLHRRTDTGELLPTIGLANTLTGLRGLGAAFLLGRLVGGVSTPVWLALLVFVVGVLTDILDGWVARSTKTQSKLGQIIDGEADFCLYLALSIILVQNAILPLWLALILVARFFVPLLAALISYFLFATPVRFGSTLWGKGAGVAQCLYFFVLLAPAQLARITQIVNMPFLILTIVLTLVAPLAQLAKHSDRH